MRPHSIQGSGPLLIYVCGLDGTGELFFKQVPGLSRSFTVVTFRQRGRGEFTLDDLADDVARMIQGLGKDRATVVAESFGGAVALTLALRHPELIERMVLVNAFSRYRNRFGIRLVNRLASLVPFRVVTPIRSVAGRIGLFVDRVAAPDRRLFSAAVDTIEPEGYVHRLRLIDELNLDDKLALITVPVLLIASRRDLLVNSTREAEFMAARIPGASMHVFRDAGHACLMGDRVRLADLIERWVHAAPGTS